MGISRREYARRRGVSEKAVRKALADGRIKQSLLPDDSIDPDLADRLWEENTDPTQRRGAASQRAEASIAARIEGADPASAPRSAAYAPAPIPDLASHVAANRARAARLPEAGNRGDRETILDMAVQERAEKIRRMKRENDVAEGLLVPAAQERALHYAAIRAITHALEAWPDHIGSEIAGEFDIDSFRFTRRLKDGVRDLLLSLSKKSDVVKEASDGTED